MLADCIGRDRERLDGALARAENLPPPFVNHVTSLFYSPQEEFHSGSREFNRNAHFA